MQRNVLFHSKINREKDQTQTHQLSLFAAKDKRNFAKKFFVAIFFL